VNAALLPGGFRREWSRHSRFPPLLLVTTAMGCSASVPEDEAAINLKADECRIKLQAIVGVMGSWEQKHIDGTRSLIAKSSAEVCQAFADYHSSHMPGAQFPGISNKVKARLLSRLQEDNFAETVRAKVTEVDEAAKLADKTFLFDTLPATDVTISASPEKRMLRVSGTVTGRQPLNLAERAEVAEYFPSGFLDRSAFSFAATIVKTSHEATYDGVNRVFSFGNTQGGEMKNFHDAGVFSDEIGARSWPAAECWIYAYGEDGRVLDGNLGYTNATGADGWVLHQTSQWLFTCSEHGALSIWKDGKLVASCKCKQPMRQVRRRHLYIGGHPFWPHGWRGTITDALIWDRAVSWEEMLEEKGKPL